MSRKAPKVPPTALCTSTLGWPMSRLYRRDRLADRALVAERRT
jgi:hypothetical protein